MKGGGTQVTFETDRWRAQATNGVLQEGGIEYIVLQFYDADNAGVFTMVWPR